MPINKITSTKRGKAMVLAGMVAAAATGWTTWKQSQPVITPASIHQALKQGITPPAVDIAIKLITPWEGMRTTAYLDSVGVPTICIGETEIDGKPVRLGMVRTEKWCKDRFIERVTYNYYLPLVDNVPDFVLAPDSVQAASTSVAYNVGTGAITRKSSTARKYIIQHKYLETCAALTAFNRAGGKFWVGLGNRREMGDDTRVGEAEVCLSTEVKL